MSEAEKRIREALADEALYDEGASVSDTLYAAHVFEEACSPENIAALLADRDEREAKLLNSANYWKAEHVAANTEIDRLTRERDEARAERDAMRAALNTIARTLAMPFPDPGAHSERAYQTARAALAQIEQERSEQAREGA